jgi:hypothetical protein
VLLIVILPPWHLIMRLQSAKPNPFLLAFVVIGDFG